MSSSSMVIATTLSQLRNTALSCIVNKADPFNAISCYYAMISTLPPGDRPNLDDIQEVEPKPMSFQDDPDQSLYQQQAWKFLRRLMCTTEESISSMISQAQSRRQFS
jgi:hypothetical protein